MLGAVGCAEVNEFVDVVLYVGLAQHGIGDQCRTHAAQRETVGLGDIEDVIGGLPTAAGWHVLDDDVRIAWNVLAQEVRDRARAHIGGTRGRPAEDDGNGLAGVELRLSEARAGARCPEAQYGDNCGDAHDKSPAEDATKPSYSSPRELSTMTSLKWRLPEQNFLSGTIPTPSSSVPSACF